VLEAIEHGIGPAAFAESLAWALLQVGAVKGSIGKVLIWPAPLGARRSLDLGKVDMLTTYGTRLPENAVLVARLVIV